MTDDDYNDDPVEEELVQFAEELADAAGAVILKYWRLPIEVVEKHEPGRPEPDSPVTVADREAEAAMRALIEARYPAHGIYGEEHGEARVGARFVWVLDPIDGTKSFVTGKPLFGTLIGLLRDGAPVLGVIDQCVTRERWVGANGRGCALNGARVRAASRATGLGGALLYATTPSMFAPGAEARRFARVARKCKRAMYGCDCYAYALVASGFGADAVVEADLGLYDYCALVPVLRAGGARVSDWEGRALTLARFRANPAPAGTRGRVVAAANDALWRALVAELRDDSDGWRARVADGARALALPSVALGAALGAALALALARR